MAEVKSSYLQQWESAKTFSDLISLNMEYLEGYIPGTPYHHGPVKQETHSLIPALLRLHDFGVLTCGSQPYEQSIEYNDGVYYEHRQKPFVSVVMDDVVGPSKILENLKKVPDISVYGARLHPYRVENGTKTETLTVTQIRSARFSDCLKNFEWEDCTHIYPINLSEEDFFKLDVMKQRKLWLIDVAATEWGVDLDIPKLIEQSAIEAGLFDTKATSPKTVGVDST